MDTKKTLEDQYYDNWKGERGRRVEAEKLLSEIFKRGHITDPDIIDRIVARLGYEPVR